jgi:hypothetical protein
MGSAIEKSVSKLYFMTSIFINSKSRHKIQLLATAPESRINAQIASRYVVYLKSAERKIGLPFALFFVHTLIGVNIHYLYMLGAIP